MINVNIYVGDGRYELCIDGHAGSAECGRDLVCCAVSTIAYTLLGYLANAKCDKSEHIESGKMLIRCVGGDNVSTAFDMAQIGLQQIAIKYPQYVRVTIHTAHGS